MFTTANLTKTQPQNSNTLVTVQCNQNFLLTIRINLI